MSPSQITRRPRDYISGIASFSLHGRLCGVLALGSTFVGLWLRPLFGLTNPKPADSTC